MAEKGGNLKGNSRFGSRGPERRKTAMNDDEILLEDEEYLDEPDLDTHDYYLDDDYLDSDDYDFEDGHFDGEDYSEDGRFDSDDYLEDDHFVRDDYLEDDHFDREDYLEDERFEDDRHLVTSHSKHIEESEERYVDPHENTEKEEYIVTDVRRRSRAKGNRGTGAGHDDAKVLHKHEEGSKKGTLQKENEHVHKTRNTSDRTSLKTEDKKEAKKSGKKTAIIAACAAGVLIVAGGAIYAGMSQRYKTRFFPNTQINGVDASGKTAAEVQDLISAGVDGYTLTIEERNDQKENIAGTDIKLHAKFDGSLEKMVAAQKPLSWILHMKQEEYTIETMVAYDDAALKNQIQGLSCLDETNMVEPVNAQISDYVEGQGYSIVPEHEGTVVEEDKLTQAIIDAIENLKDTLSLEEADVYKKPTVLQDDASLAEQLEKINQYAKMSVTYQFGDSTEVLGAEKIHDWLISNEDGTISVDSAKVAEYVAELAKAHNTSNKAKTLKTSYGSTIQVSGGTYGWKINQAAETEALVSIITSGESVTREPEYSQKAASHGSNDYGDTYVEINLTGQHLFYYKEGKLVVESDFVSGNLSKGWGTPAGTYPLSYKQKNAVLKGANYRTPVSYWMPFNNGIGMHDANWRSSFGGTIYKTNGSHGCINLPPAVAKTIFENISAGTPVICYNLDGTEKSTTTGTSKTSQTKAAETAAPTVTPTTAPTIAETTAPTTAPTQSGPGAQTVSPTQSGPGAETTAPTTAPTAAPTQTEIKSPEATSQSQSGPGGPGSSDSGNTAAGPGA